MSSLQDCSTALCRAASESLLYLGEHDTPYAVLEFFAGCFALWVFLRFRHRRKVAAEMNAAMSTFREQTRDAAIALLGGAAILFIGMFVIFWIRDEPTQRANDAQKLADSRLIELAGTDGKSGLRAEKDSLTAANGTLTKQLQDVNNQLKGIRKTPDEAAKAPPKSIIKRETTPIIMQSNGQPVKDRSKFTKPLQNFYAKGLVLFQLLDNPNLSDDDILKLETASDRWRNEVFAWITPNMGDSATAKFGITANRVGLSYSLPGKHADGVKDRRDLYLNALSAATQNIDDILASDRWDP